MLKVERIVSIGNRFDLISGGEIITNKRRRNSEGVKSFEDVLNSEMNRIKETVRNYEQARR